MMRWYWTWSLIFTLLLGAYGCATTNSTPAAVDIPGCEVSSADQAPVSAPRKICILPVKVKISELNAGGTTEEVPQWSAEGKKIVKQRLYEYFKINLDVEIVPVQAISEENQRLVDQYRALYELVAANQRYIKNIAAWSHLNGRMVTLGKGMARLKEQLNADAILFVSGYDYHSTAGRKTAFVLYAALTGGAALPMGHCALHTGLVELETGDILWTFTNISGEYSLKKEQDVYRMIQQSFSGFPRVDSQEDENVRSQ
jgi:hypothetical protein